MAAASKGKKHVFNSLDFFILALILLTLASFIFKSQLSGLFRGREAEAEVRILLNCGGADVKTAQTFLPGDEIIFEDRSLGRVASVSFYEDEAEGPQALVAVTGTSSRDPDGVWSFSGRRLPTGDRAVITCAGESVEAWVLEIVPASSAAEITAPFSTGPIAAAD